MTDRQNKFIFAARRRFATALPRYHICMERQPIRLDNYEPPCIKTAGGTVRAYTSKVICGNKAMTKLAEAAADVMPAGRIALCRSEGLDGLSSVAADILRKAGYFVDEYPVQDGSLDEKNLRDDDRLLIAVGGGSAANAVKHAASVRGSDWIYVMTCASTDSGLYSYAEFFENGARSVQRCTPPAAVVADDAVICAAPARCTAAGFGTLCSKLLVLFSLRSEKLTDGKDDPAADLLEENLGCFFEETSCENFAPRIARALIRTGLTEQCCPSPDYLQREEYTAALTLSAYTGGKRLIGEDMMLAFAAIRTLYGCYLEHAPSDLFLPCGFTEDFRMLDKLCGLDMLTLTSAFSRDPDCIRKMFVLREYRSELADILNGVIPSPQTLIRRFRRLYDDVGFWLGEYITPQKLLGIVNLSAALLRDGSMLRPLKQSGFLDVVCREMNVSL